MAKALRPEPTIPPLRDVEPELGYWSDGRKITAADALRFIDDVTSRSEVDFREPKRNEPILGRVIPSAPIIGIKRLVRWASYGCHRVEVEFKIESEARAYAFPAKCPVCFPGAAAW